MGLIIAACCVKLIGHTILQQDVMTSNLLL
jgi:hypothetical protein